MPLLHGKKAATAQGKSENIRRLSGEIGHSPHVQSHDQAVAIAMNIARKRAQGGEADSDTHFIHEHTANPKLFEKSRAPSHMFDQWSPEHEAQGRSEQALRMWRRARGEMAEGGGQRMLPLNGAPGAGAREAAFQGPLKTPTPGRTDRHKINVKSGSYVVPADIVSILGEGNTEAGHAVLAMMFPPSHIRSAAPHPPHGVKVKPQAEGGANDNETGNYVPIIAAGGEHVLSPDRISSRFYDINQGHDELDKMVKIIRQQEIERLKKAPPPKT